MTDEEKAEWYADKILSDSKYPFIFSKEKVKAYIIKVYLDSLKCCENAYYTGFSDGRNERDSIIEAMESIKNYCIEISKENGDCRKCIFCSKGYNGCKLQTSPNNWELAE